MAMSKKNEVWKHQLRRFAWIVSVTGLTMVLRG